MGNNLGQSTKQWQERLANKERSFKMKNAKRILSLILVLAMMLSSGITLYAGGGGLLATVVTK